MAIDAAELSEKFQEFIEQQYQTALHEALAHGRRSLLLDFFLLAEFDPALADQLLEEPEETIKAAEFSLEQFEVKKGFKIRFKNLPKSQEIFIRNLRSVHLGTFIAVEGVIRRSTEVRPQAVSAKFECPSCGNVITLAQFDQQFREPSRCSCGRKGKFRLLSKELVDVQLLVIEESPETLEGGAQPKRLQVLIREDLVEPRMEKRTVPGTRIIVNGYIYEVPIPTKTGATSTRFDLAMEANYIETVQEDYSEVQISPEDEKVIKECARDTYIFERLIASIAPSIYGHDKIKEAIMLQMFGGIRKTKKDGTVIRGDSHLLLVGDPGCIAGDSHVALFSKGMEQIQRLGQYHLQPIREAVVKIRKNAKDSRYDVATVFQKYEQQPVLRVVTETGKEVLCTFNQPFLTKEGWMRADSILLGTKIRVMPKIPNIVKKLVPTGFMPVKKSFGKLKDVSVPKEFTPELASLCGYIIGDGNIHPNGSRVTCYVSDEEKELVSPITTFFHCTFGISPQVLTKIQDGKIKTIDDGNGMLRQFVSTQTMHLLEVNSRQVAHSLSFLSSKRVPQQIFKSPTHVVASFLRWLFEADGCAFGNGRGRTAIQLKSRTPGLLKDVQLLLLYFGIQSRIVQDNLCIRRSHDIELFIRYVGFHSQKKNNALANVLEVVAAREKRRKGYQRWEKVVQIDFEGFMDVYDFEVPKSHSFIANGILCHNSGKSQLLTFVDKVAPKSRYVAGRSASGAGLCVSPDSFVLTNPGGMLPIQEVVEKRIPEGFEYRPGIWRKDVVTDIKIQSMSPDFKLHSKAPQSVWKLEAPLIMYQVVLSSGKRVELTGNTSLFSIKDGKTFWKKSCELSVGDYVATPRRLIGGDAEDISVVPFICSNPVVHDIKPFIRKVIATLAQKYGSIRNAARALGVRENQLYFHWVNERARGNIKLKTLVKLCSVAGIPYEDHVRKVSLYNGKRHTLPSYLTSDFLYICGLIAGDGHIRKTPSTYAVGFSNTREELHLYVRDVLVSQFSLHYSVQKGDAQRPMQTCWTSKIFAEILFGLGMVPSPKSNKIFFSEALLHLSNSLLAEYIAGLFDTDGSVYIRSNKRQGCIDFTTCSEKLARQLQLVLLRYEIHSHLRVRPPSVNAKVQGKFLKYVLEIRSQDNIRRFAAHIPLRHPMKKEKLQFLASLDTVTNTNIDIIPGVGQALYALLRKKRCLKKLHWHKNMSFAALHTLLQNVSGEEFAEFRKLAESDIFWEKVAAVREIRTPYPYVYDMTIQDSHNFVVDGVLVHNTCTVVKDEFLRGWALEAGAMVLADKGILVLDEMDKISEEDTSALHEAMEQQRISIAKANIQATLRTQTSILAAANPKLGRFDPFTPIPKQIDLPPALINRFDLIFIVRDLPNKELDARIATRVLESHAHEEPAPEISAQTLRKYIAYAKQNCFPKLTKEATESIKNFYVDLRSTGTSGDAAIKPIPISARQLEAIVRLAEASARVRLKKEVEQEDALRAIALLRHCMNEVGIDPETGKIDIDRMTTGISASARGRIVEVRNVIFSLCEEKQGAISVEQDLKPKVFDKGITEQKLDEAIDTLKRQGDIFEPKKGFLQKI